MLKNKDKDLEYGDTVTRRYGELNNLSENTDPSIMYEHFIIANQEAIKNLLPKKPKYVINTLQHSTAIDSCKEVNDTFKRHIEINSTENSYKLQNVICKMHMIQ